MKTFYADFHIHCGSALGRPVKISAANTLTVETILHHARAEKGLDLVTLIDGVCTNVLTELKELHRRGQLQPLEDGGYEAENGLVILPGSEVEVGGPEGGAAHFGCWFRDFAAASDFHDWLGTVQTNPTLSSQRARVDAQTLQTQAKARGGMFIVHHAFTPHKGLYGNCVTHLQDMVETTEVDALELGLSADTEMADCLSELYDVTFISDSDAHSLQKIAREYNRLNLVSASFDEVQKAFHRQSGRFVSGNYGLAPQLGKYHQSRCQRCGTPWVPLTRVCTCGSQRTVKGVFDRLVEIRDLERPLHPSHRPPYVYQIPLEFVPGLGKKGFQKLLAAFGTEMNILHLATFEQLAHVVGSALAQRIDKARSGQVEFLVGGGGEYGKVLL